MKNAVLMLAKAIKSNSNRKQLELSRHISRRLVTPSWWISPKKSGLPVVVNEDERELQHIDKHKAG